MGASQFEIGLSKYCALRPKWCVLAGASGTHLVCVREIHFILFIHGARIEKGYKDLILNMVCVEARRALALCKKSEC